MCTFGSLLFTFVPKCAHFYFVFLVPQAVPTAVRTCTWRKKMKKPVNDIIDDVQNEADAARHRFSNKAPVSFFFFGIINHQWWLMITKTIKLIGALLDKLYLAASDSSSTSLMLMLTRFFIFFCSCVSSRTRTHSCR